MSSAFQESASFTTRLQAAIALHRAGHLDEAERQYREFLSQDGTNGEVLGLLALVAHAKSSIAEAKELWRQALASVSPAWVRLRDLNNFLVTLIEEGEEDEARAVVDSGIPTWPSERIPSEHERTTIISLAAILIKFRRDEAAQDLLESAAQHLCREAEALETLGILRFAKTDFAAALSAFEAAEKAASAPTPASILSGIAASLLKLGRGEEASAFVRRYNEAASIHLGPTMPTQRTTVLVLAQSARKITEHVYKSAFNFRGNYPSQISRRLVSEFHFVSMFYDAISAREAASWVPHPTIVINNVVNAEALSTPGTIAKIAEVADVFGVPVVNHPIKAATTTRQRMLELLSGVPGLLVPDTWRYLNDKQRTAELVETIESRFPYPLICRTPFAQEGKGMARIESRAALVEDLGTRPEDQFYVTAFVESRHIGGFYRKIRAAIVGDDIVLVRVDYDTDWNIHGRKSPARRSFYRANRHLLDEEKRIVADPEAVLGATAMQALSVIRDRVPLEIFGIDFDVMNDGTVLFFEANASMNLLSTATADIDIDHPAEAEHRLRELIAQYIRQVARLS